MRPAATSCTHGTTSRWYGRAGHDRIVPGLSANAAGRAAAGRTPRRRWRLPTRAAQPNLCGVHVAAYSSALAWDSERGHRPSRLSAGAPSWSPSVPPSARQKALISSHFPRAPRVRSFEHRKARFCPAFRSPRGTPKGVTGLRPTSRRGTIMDPRGALRRPRKR
jgi:hypothetical protein